MLIISQESNIKTSSIINLKNMDALTVIEKSGVSIIYGINRDTKYFLGRYIKSDVKKILKDIAKSYEKGTIIFEMPSDD